MVTMDNLLRMYATLGSAILAGICNSLWCKSKTTFLDSPIDNYKDFIDGKRIFGENKTWKGLVGYVVFNLIFAIIFGVIFNLLNINNYNYFYQAHANTMLFNLLIGVLIGLAYSLFVLPNSFLKRRLNIKPGKSAHGWKKIFFIILDQADSVFGVCLVVHLFYPMPLGFYLLYVIVGSSTHIIINMLLYFVGLRKNMF